MGSASHALFEPVDPATSKGKPPRDIHWIRIQRVMPDGPPLSYPGHPLASDLRTLEDLHRLVGGGTYILTATNEANSLMTARTTHRLDGRPLPMLSPSQRTAISEESERAAAAPAPASPMGGGSNDLLLYMLKAGDERAVRSEAAAQRAHEAMMLSMSNQQAGMMQLVTAILTRPAEAPSGGSLQGLRDGIALVKEIGDVHDKRTNDLLEKAAAMGEETAGANEAGALEGAIGTVKAVLGLAAEAKASGLLDPPTPAPAPSHAPAQQLPPATATPAPVEASEAVQ